MIDITGQIGPLWTISGESNNQVRESSPEWPMYSYDRPAYQLWNSIANTLHEAGWSEAHIKEWLQSKNTRLALDSELGDAIEELGRRYAKEHILKRGQVGHLRTQ